MNRSSAALSDPPTLLWVTIKAVMTAQKPCGSASAWARPKAARLDAVMRRACTAFGPWRGGSRQPLTASVLARRHSPACPLTHVLPCLRGALWHGNVAGLLRHVVALPDGWTLGHRFVPALHVRVLIEIDALPCEARDPGPDRDIGDRVVVRHERALGQAAVQDAVQTARLLGEAVLGIRGRALVEVEEMVRLPQHRANPAHLPHQPLKDAIAGLALARDPTPRLVCQVDQDRPGLHQAHPALPVHDGRYLVVGADRQEVRRELLILGDVDRVRRVGKPKLLKEDRNLAAVRGRPGIKIDHASSPDG